MSGAPSPAARPDRDLHCDPHHACVTCGDVAVALRVLAIDEDRDLGLCEDEHGRRETVEVALVQPVSVGDELLVHAGTAIAMLHPSPAAPGRGSRSQSPRRSRGQVVEAGAEEAAG